jgi:hypothetical protein
MKAASATPWAPGPRGPALLDAATRGGRLDRGAALVLADWLEENDQDRLAARVRALARADPEAEGPPPAGPDGLEVNWGPGHRGDVGLSLEAGRAWLPGPDGRARRRLGTWVYLTAWGYAHAPPVPTPGHVCFRVSWQDRVWGRHLPGGPRLFLDVPRRLPKGALAAVAYEACAAALLARLLGAHGASGEAVVVRA